MLKSISYIHSLLFQEIVACPGQVAQLVGVSTHAPKGWGFHPLLGYVWEATD